MYLLCINWTNLIYNYIILDNKFIIAGKAVNFIYVFTNFIKKKSFSFLVSFFIQFFALETLFQ